MYRQGRGGPKPSSASFRPARYGGVLRFEFAFVKTAARHIEAEPDELSDKTPPRMGVDLTIGANVVGGRKVTNGTTGGFAEYRFAGASKFVQIGVMGEVPSEPVEPLGVVGHRPSAAMRRVMVVGVGGVVGGAPARPQHGHRGIEAMLADMSVKGVEERVDEVVVSGNTPLGAGTKTGTRSLDLVAKNCTDFPETFWKSSQCRRNPQFLEESHCDWLRVVFLCFFR